MATNNRLERSVLSDDERSELDSDSSTGTGFDSEDESEMDEEGLDPTWSNETSGLRRFDFTKEDGLLVPIPGENTPADWFFMLLDEPFLEDICRETNKYAFELFCGPSTTPNSRITKYKDITVAELKTFIGLLLHTGTIRLNRLQDYWKTQRLFNIPLFREHMSRNRFLIILRCLHFASPPRTADVEVSRLHKIDKVVDYFNNKMKAVYYPTRELSLDEAMVLWRGRLSFRQYIKGKRHKYGIKLYSLNEPHGLTMRFLIYSGKEGELSGKGHTSKVVLRLMQGFLNHGHSLYMDNFYNSFALSAKLLSKNTYCTGTLRANRKHNPQDVTSAKLKKGETITRYAEGVMVGKWRDKRTVLYLSTEFENNMVTMENKRKQQKEKPLPVVQYNAHMKGVDRHDQLMSYYPCERKTLRWYKKMFIHVLQMIVVNGMILYNAANIDKKMTLYDFRLSIIESLLPPKERQAVITPPRNPTHTSIKNEDRDRKGDRKRKDCRQCYKSEKKRKMTTFTCTACPDKPGLCAGKCFDEYHRNMNMN